MHGSGSAGNLAAAGAAAGAQGGSGSGAKPGGMPGGDAGSSQSQSNAQAYGAFNGVATTPGKTMSFNAGGGFGQGGVQGGKAQNMQSFPADQSGGGAGAEAAAPGPALDMRNNAVQQTLQVMSGSNAFGGPTSTVDVLMHKAKTVATPDVALQDKVHFVFNNLSNTNLEQKEKDLATGFDDAYMPWLSQYIVIKRAAQEANYHGLYLQFLDKLDRKIPQLAKTVLSISIDNVTNLLSDEKITSSSSLRSLLKNLGSWLGSLTLSKNKPILQRDLDIKALLIDAYERGRLIAVVPFVAKVLDCAANSRIFRPPNPWTMMVLGILAEMHPIADLKLNIKFEIEVLCKNLNKDIKDIKQTSVLEGRKVVKEGNPDWTSRDSAAVANLQSLPTIPDARLVAAAAGVSQSPPGAAGSTSSPSPMKGGQDDVGPGGSGQAGGQGAAAGSSSSSANASATDLTNINIGQYATISSNIGITQQYPQLKPLIIQVITQAIREMITPVVERSVTIACITTRELILKDLAFETEESTFKFAAHMMVQSLAGSLALVTCKEPLRHSMVNHLSVMLQSSQLSAMLQKSQMLDAAAIEQASHMIATDNLDLGCSIIEKAATEKAVREIDSALDIALKQRRVPGTPLHEAYVQMRNWSRYLPDSLRPKQGGLAPHHKRVYEDFARLRTPPGIGAPSTDAVRAFEGGSGPGTAAGGAVGGAGGGAGAGGAVSNGARLIVDKCLAVMSKAEDIVMRSPQIAASPLLSLPPGHELTQLIIQCRSLALQAGPAVEEVCLGCSSKLFRRIYDSTKFGRCTLGVEWLIAMMTALNDASKQRVAREVPTWLVSCEGKTNRELTVALISAHLLSPNAPEYVKEMTKLMEGGRVTHAVDFIVDLLQCVLVERRIVSTNDCVSLLDTLSKMAAAARGKPPDNVVKLLDEARAMVRSGVGAAKQAAPFQGAPPSSSASSSPSGGIELGVGVAKAIVSIAKVVDTMDPQGLKEQVRFRV